MSIAQRAQRLIALFNQQRYREAERLARQLTGEHPDYAFAWKVLGAAVTVQGGNGMPMLERAVQLMPDDHEAHNNLGNAYLEAGRFEDAAASYRRALALKPDYAHAHGNLGNALRELGRWPEAVSAYRRALETEPGFAEAHSNLGGALLDLGEFEQAIVSLRRALELDPDSIQAHSNLGRALLALGELEQASLSLRRVLELDPDFAEAHSTLLFALNCVELRSSAELVQEARRYGGRVARRGRPFQRWPNPPDPARELHVGLVSSDLRSHPVGYFLESFVAALSSHRLCLHAYQTRGGTDALTERLRARMASWHRVSGMSDEDLARRIRDDGIDILVDLSGHTVHNRLPVFAWRPAPVQVTWLGYFATTGVPGMDYILVDRVSVPEGEEAGFTERVWRLAETRLCFSPPELDVRVAPLPALAAGYVTFGCFGNQAKANDAVIATWAEVLHALPGAKLFLKAAQLAVDSARARLLGRFALHGIGAERLIVEGASPRREYLEAYNRVDVALDTFPYPGGTTTVEGLWMGVPVITLRGKRLLSRQGESLVANAGLEAWIATDRRHYVELAVAMSSDRVALARLRESLRARLMASPLMDAPRFAAHFEAALRGMWRRWCEGVVQKGGGPAG